MNSPVPPAPSASPVSSTLPAPTVPPPDESILTVSQLANLLKELLENTGPFWVRGEISNLNKASSGHQYFSLKDQANPLRAVLYRGVGLRLKFELRDGQEVVAKVRPSVYTPRGDLQLMVEELQPVGLGAAELGLRQLKERLLAAGYFAPERKRPLPRFPRLIALVTSPTGAAVRDMLEVLVQRWPLAEVVVRPSLMQGEGAAQAIAQAVRQLSDLAVAGVLVPDVIVLGRGGGSVEDLWPFNAEILAQAIYESFVPVVSAVGHETDTTIADLVADRRGMTPSQAMTQLVPDRHELHEELDALGERLNQRMRQRLHSAQRRLDELRQRPALAEPHWRLQAARHRLDELDQRLSRATRYRQTLARDRLAALAAQLDALSPLRVLQRGYTLTRREDGAIVRSAAEVRPGQRLRIQTAQGTIVSRVESTQATTNDSPTTTSHCEER